MARELAVVLCNGSLASAVTAAVAAPRHRVVLAFVEPGPNAGRPGQAFDALVTHFKPYRSHRLPMPFLASFAKADPGGASAGEADPRSGEGVAARLLDLLPVVAMGLRLAAHYNAVALFAGLRAGADGGGNDLARVAEFGQCWAELVQLTCGRPDLDVLLPLLELEAWQVVDLGQQVSAPLQLTWSCDGVVGDPCGQCRGCRQRDAAFVRAGRPDPAKQPASPQKAAG